MSTEKPKMKITRIASKQMWDDFNAMYHSTTIVAHFSASWSDACAQVNEVLDELVGDVNPSNVTLCTIEAERVPKASLQFDIVAVPTVLFIQNGNVVCRVNGTHIPQIVAKVEEASKGVLQPVDDDKQTLHDRLRRLISKHKCVVFIKGTPDQPRCGFSQRLIGMLTEANADYDYFDILTDNEVREGLKELSDWPTYPQMYIDGELVGGLDIITEQMAAGELQLPKKVDWDTRLTSLINASPVTVFMKGTADAPLCKFSKALMGILNEEKISFGTFDILGDEEVRARLKEFSDWPTYPQVYVDGKLIGGLDIVKELREAGELKNELATK